jgi:hypothetical protein
MTCPDALDAARLASFLDGQAAVLLDEYFNSNTFTGGHFERFAGGGDRPEVADRFTSDDVVAVSLLSVRIPGQAALQLLDAQANELNVLLSGIPVGSDLWQAPEEAVAPGSSADRLWRRLDDVPGIGWVTAGKLLARKRPRLIPVYDRVVKAALGRKDEDEWWRPLRTALHENPDLVAKLKSLRDHVALDHPVSLLRILDVCIWMRKDGTPEPEPDAET